MTDVIICPHCGKEIFDDETPRSFIDKMVERCAVLFVRSIRNNYADYKKAKDRCQTCIYVQRRNERLPKGESDYCIHFSQYLSGLSEKMPNCDSYEKTEG